MKKRDKTLKQLNISLPKNWSELTPAQIMRVAYHLSNDLTQTEYLLALAIEFAGLKPHGTAVLESGDIGYVYYDRNLGNITLTTEQVAVIASAMEWIVGEPSPMAAPELDGYKTPDRDLYDVSVEQFVTADTACSHYINTKNVEALRMMVAVLYNRKSYDPAKLKAEARRLNYLPSWHLDAVLLWFMGVKKMLMQKYPYVFSSEGGGSAAPDGEATLLGMLSGLNDGRVADNDKIKQLSIHEALHELNQKIKIAQKNK